MQDGFLALARGEILGPWSAPCMLPSGGFHFRQREWVATSPASSTRISPATRHGADRRFRGSFSCATQNRETARGVRLHRHNRSAYRCCHGSCGAIPGAEGARVATIVGCGAQSRAQIRALNLVRPLKRVYAYDLDPLRAEKLAGELGVELGIEISAVSDLAICPVGESDLHHLYSIQTRR